MASFWKQRWHSIIAIACPARELTHEETSPSLYFDLPFIGFYRMRIHLVNTKKENNKSCLTHPRTLKVYKCSNVKDTYYKYDMDNNICIFSILCFKHKLWWRSYVEGEKLGQSSIYNRLWWCGVQMAVDDMVNQNVIASSTGKLHLQISIHIRINEPF